MWLTGPIRFDDEDQEDLSGCGVYVDPEYDVLWSYSAQDNRVSCFNPIATNIEGRSSEATLCTHSMHCTLLIWWCISLDFIVCPSSLVQWPNLRTLWIKAKGTFQCTNNFYLLRESPIPQLLRFHCIIFISQLTHFVTLVTLTTCNCHISIYMCYEQTARISCLFSRKMAL